MFTKKLTTAALMTALLTIAISSYLIGQRANSVTAFFNISELDPSLKFVKYEIIIVNSSDHTAVLRNSSKLVIIDDQRNSDNDEIIKAPVTIQPTEALLLTVHQDLDRKLGGIKFGTNFELQVANGNIFHSNILFGELNPNNSEEFMMSVSKLDLVSNKADQIVIHNDQILNDVLGVIGG